MKRTILLFGFIILAASLAQAEWANPIKKITYTGSPLVEVTPFTFGDRLYLLENNQTFWDMQPGTKPGTRFHDDVVRIRDLSTGRIVATPLKNHAFGTALVHNGRVYVFAGDYGEGKPWRQITEVSMTSSADLKEWTKPVTVIRAEDGEFIFNTAVCHDPDKKRFVLLYETNDPRFPSFTFEYATSDDLADWKKLPKAIYGKDRYVGGLALYYEGGWYYTLALWGVKGGYDTRVARSKDLVDWENAPVDRPFITFDTKKTGCPLIPPERHECNASDVELCYYKGKTILYFTGNDQSTCGDLQYAEFDGTPQELFEAFFKAKASGLTKSTEPPKHDGDWIPVLIAPEEEDAGIYANEVSDCPTVKTPTANQLVYQNDQLGAFIHFGPASCMGNSDMHAFVEPSKFNPKNLDAEQWVKAAKSFGAKHVLLTAKHHNGYCLWPTATTDYSIRSSAWKDGQGDIIKEFVDACRKHGVKPGIYISAGDKHFPCFASPDPMGKRKVVGDIDAYFKVYKAQVRELASNYGELCAFWFDGAYDCLGWDVKDAKAEKRLGYGHGDEIAEMVHKLQPTAVIMGGTQPNGRWSGSEQGWAPYPMWNVIPKGAGLKNWTPPREHGWRISEANMHTRSTWFWMPGNDHTLASVERLMKVYHESICRGANLLVNMTPDDTGRIPDVEVKRLGDFGKELKRLYGAPLATKEGTFELSKNGCFTIELEKATPIREIEIEEDIAQGQHVAEYVIERFADGRWQEIAKGETIGRRRVQPLDGKEVKQLRIRVTKTRGPIQLRAVRLFGVK